MTLLNSKKDPYDLIIIGGALSGSATALIAKRKLPSLRILIIERNESFSRKVGESTVEVSSYFLGKTLGITDYLIENHLVKQGLRFWFYNDKSIDLESCSEIGPLYNVRFPSFQVDRSEMDAYLLSLCEKEGIEILRPAEVKAIELQAGGMQRVEVKQNQDKQTFQARWIVDASGMAKKVAKKENWVQGNTEHPIASAWSRWKGVKSWDSAEIRAQYPKFANRTFALRNPATNHLIGHGWWSWWIPLKGGDVSIGIVYDERIVQLPLGENIMERITGLLYEHPIAKLLLENAKPIEKDIYWRKNFSYCSQKIVTNGAVLVGDAAGFIDPFYSPGMDWIGYTTYSAAQLIVKERTGKLIDGEIEAQNQLFTESYQRWFEAIYKDKYYYMGDYELMRIAFNLDLSLYYLGVVSQPFKNGDKSFLKPPLAGAYTNIPFMLIKTYNKRLAAIGQKRWKQNRWGQHNDQSYSPFISFGFDYKLPLHMLKFLGVWFILEIKECFK